VLSEDGTNVKLGADDKSQEKLRTNKLRQDATSSDKKPAKQRQEADARTISRLGFLVNGRLSATIHTSHAAHLYWRSAHT
jgi:hypothetical protein